MMCAVDLELAEKFFLVVGYHDAGVDRSLIDDRLKVKNYAENCLERTCVVDYRRRSMLIGS